MLTNICTWSGHISPSIISTPFHWHNFRIISLTSSRFSAKNILEQAEEIRQREQNYADALRSAENGEFTKDRKKLKEQVIALIAENKDMLKRLETSMNETLAFAKENRALKADNERKSRALEIAVKLKEQNPMEFNRIVYGRPIGGTMERFFSSVLSLFTPEVTNRSRRLKEIEEELKDERERQENLNGYYHSR